VARRKAVLVVAPVAALLAALSFGTSTAGAAPGVVQDLPGCRAHQLPANDDDSTDLVALGFTANIYDSSFTQAYVNNNGNITFDAPLGDYTPFDFREANAPSIDPFFADVDTSGDGSGLVNYGTTTYDGHAAFCVLWDHVGYFSSHTDKTNTFQAILVDRGSDGVDVVFNYDNLTWETGDASDGTNGFGGSSAVAGYAAGDGDSAHALISPGSFVNGGLLDSNASSSLAGHSTAGQPAGRYVYQLRTGAATGGRIFGTVTAPGGDTVAGAIVQVCPSSGPCVSRTADSNGDYRASNLPAGNYRVTGFPGPDGDFSSTVYDNVTVGIPGTQTQRDIVLGPAPGPPPPGTTVEPRIDDDPDGVPTAYWGDPLQISTLGCAGGDATYKVVLHGAQVRSGGMTEGPSGRYTATVAALMPDHGTGEVQIHIDCPGPTTDEDVDFGIYIDPSGVVRDQAGNPAPDAEVTLYRSASAAGPFFAVPSGSAVMSPSNRDNPDFTDGAGRFGWDVVAGYYVVKASLGSCAAESSVLSIPPPVTDLDLRLSCPGGAAPSSPVVTGQPPQTTAGPRELVTIGKAKLAKGRTLAVGVRCAKTAIQACSGTVGVRIGKKAVGKKAFKKLKPNSSTTVKVKLSKKGRELVRKVKRGKKVRFAVSAAVRDAAGIGKTAKRTVTIKRR
jgi:Nidogen-like/Carboxypeptidase regulatory-like domain